MEHKGYLVERYCDYSAHDGFKGWVHHKMTVDIGGARRSITQARKHHYKNDIFRIIELVSNEEEINI